MMSFNNDIAAHLSIRIHVVMAAEVQSSVFEGREPRAERESLLRWTVISGEVFACAAACHLDALEFSLEL